jgi:hypothetical protein
LQPCITTFEVTMFKCRKSKQVLFLEAGKDFMDALCRILVLPGQEEISCASQTYSPRMLFRVEYWSAIPGVPRRTTTFVTLALLFYFFAAVSVRKLWFLPIAQRKSL